jgi:hypothetical protein
MTDWKKLATDMLQANSVSIDQIEQLTNERDRWRRIADLFYVGSGGSAVEEYEQMARMQRIQEAVK